MRLTVTVKLDDVTLAEAQRDIVVKDVLDLVLLANGQAALDASIRGLIGGTRAEVRNPRTRQTIHYFQEQS